MTWLLRLYPRAWRERYGAELEDLVASRPASLQLAVDLLGGAIDAHWNPQSWARRYESEPETARGDRDMIHRLKGCCSLNDVTTRESMMAAGITLLSALVLAGFLIVNDSKLTETVLLTMSPGIWILPVQVLKTRGHSPIARTALLVGPLLVLLAIGLTAGLIVAD